MVTTPPAPSHRLLPPLSVAVTVTVFSFAALALPLAAALSLGLSPRATSAWLLASTAFPASSPSSSPQRSGSR
jgi:hypothetical protein